MTDAYGAQLRAQLAEAREQLAAAEAERDGAYRERAYLLAWLAALYPAVLVPALDVDEDGWQILYLTAGGQQLSWHIHPSEAELFKRVPRIAADDPRAQWDGHSTPEKYGRIRRQTTALNLMTGGHAVDPATRAGIAEARIAAVRALHSPVQHQTLTICDACSTKRSTGPRGAWTRHVIAPWPCETLAALDGPTADGEPEQPAAVPPPARACRPGFCRPCRTIHAPDGPS
jgi:hypothetical protein